VPILVAARTYLIDALAEVGTPLEVAIVPPSGPLAKTKSYVLLSRPGSSPRSLFTTDYLIRCRVFDESAVDCHRNTDLIYGLMLAATHCHISIEPPLSPRPASVNPPDEMWITKASPGDNGPSDFADEDIGARLFGLQFAVFWTVAVKPLERNK